MHPSEVWYVSYGSNMCRDRFCCYIEGGRPHGGFREYVGARDDTLPADDMPVELPGALYFAGESPTWGGGVAFYDHDVAGPTPGRAYRITAEQFVDVAAQEMHRLPEHGDPLEEVIIGGIETGRHEAGPGRYETLIEVGQYDGLPMMTFTSPDGLEAVPHTLPAPAYLTMLRRGLRESHGWDDDEIDVYFTSLVAA